MGRLLDIVKPIHVQFYAITLSSDDIKPMKPSDIDIVTISNLTIDEWTVVGMRSEGRNNSLVTL